MKKLTGLAFGFFLLSNVQLLAQKTESFDIASYAAPIGWQKEISENAIQFSIDRGTDGGQCLLTLFKSVPASNDSRINFDASWEKIVKEVVTVSGTPEMSHAAEENGWTALSGFSSYESDGTKGLVMLVTITGDAKMVNILIFTNTDTYQQTITDFLASISLPRAVAPGNTASKSPTARNESAKSGSFRFTTTTFDDGWTATEQEDWVRVTKGSHTVLIHYAVPDIRAFNNLDESTTFVWNTLVAPRYKNSSNVWMRRSWYADGDFMNGKYFGEADVVDAATGKRVHVVLYKNGNAGKWIEFISPDKATFQKQFSVVYQQDGTDWDKLSVMSNYNKFAVAADDLVGNWGSSSGSNIQYYNIYTGNNAGMAFSSSTNEFNFLKNGSYKSVYKGVDNTLSGGGNRYHGTVYNGTYQVTNWEMKLTNRFKGATETFAVQFEAVKGGRILHMSRGSVEEIHLFKVK